MRLKSLIVLTSNILSCWYIEKKINDTSKIGMSYVCSKMKMVDLIITCVVTLIQRYGYSLENEFSELTYERISNEVLFIYQLMLRWWELCK